MIDAVPLTPACERRGWSALLDDDVLKAERVEESIWLSRFGRLAIELELLRTVEVPAPPRMLKLRRHESMQPLTAAVGRDISAR